MNAPFLQYSRQFAARAGYYRALALAEPDTQRAEILLGVSALFLEMAANMADREMARSCSSEKRRTDVVPITAGLGWNMMAASTSIISLGNIFERFRARWPRWFQSIYLVRTHCTLVQQCRQLAYTAAKDLNADAQQNEGGKPDHDLDAVGA
ncbi:MAG TPA: hypothetical protein VGH23_17725 [Rhizomicrobium sp.]|jgi:hypothetical protein